MTTETKPISREPDLSAEGINHICCCNDENRGFCGLDLSSVPFVDEDETNCVVCLDLEHVSDGSCPFTGRECP